MMAELETTHPGCLVAGFSYENKQFNNDVRELMKQGIVSWRTMIAQRLKTVLKNNSANLETSVDTLAHMFSTCIEGGIVLTLIMQDNEILVNQILAYRTHLRLVFEK